MFPELDTIREALARINELDAAALDVLKAQVADVFDAVDAEATTPENVAILQELGAGISAIMSRGEEISAQEAQAEADKESARAIRSQLNGTPDEGATDEAGTETAVDEKVEAVVAGGKFRAKPSTMRTANAINPNGSFEGRTQLVAGGGVFGKAQGDAFENRYDLGRAMSKTLRGLNRQAANGKVVVASADFGAQYPEARRLGGEDQIVSNMEKLDAVISTQALVASGGICQPVNVDYALPTWATPARPLKEGFAQFATDRGGLTYRLPPTVGALAGASGIWTEATDAAPAGATKPVLSIACAAPMTTYVNAVTTRLGFGNLQGQFDPDTVTANTDLAIVAAARIAELELLTLLQAACTANITSAKVLGTSRDWFTTIERVAANYRYTNRLDDTQTLTVVLPAWVKNAIRADRIYELAHSDANVDPFNVSDAWIESTLAVRGIKAIWTLDALAANGAVYPSQQFNGFVSGAAVPDFPTSIVWNLYVEGSVQFLDGGLLNLGVIRDASLDATNDYETFVETFEGLAYRGFSGGALQIVTTTHATGSSSATVAVA